jgi:hypothetical protein
MNLSAIDGNDCIGDSRRMINNNITTLGQSSCTNRTSILTLNNTLYSPSSGLNLNSSNKIHVDLDPIGGLEFNSNLQVRIKPSLPTLRLAVRPSVGTDSSTVSRTISSLPGDIDVSGPYFKSFCGACQYMTVNPNNNYIIFIDEDTNETLTPENVVITTSTGTSTLQLSSVENIPLNFTSANLKPGAYIWNNSATPTRSAVFGTKSTVSAVQGTVIILSRYDSGGGVFVTTRKFNQAPKKIIYNLYISNSTTLPYGSLGTDPDNWVLMPFYFTSDIKQYFPFRPFYWTGISNVQLRNICFDFDTNCTDSTCIYFNSSRLNVINTTVRCGGNTRYAWGAILCDGTGTIILGSNQTTAQRLLDPVTLEPNYPGFALAIVGPDNYTVDMMHGIRIYNGVRLFGFTVSYLGGSTSPGIGTLHHNAIILAGRINFDSQTIIGQSTVTTGDGSINAATVTFVKSGSIFTGYPYGYGSTTVRPGFITSSPNYTVLPVYLEKYNSISYSTDNGLADSYTIRQWLTTPTVNPPILTNGYIKFWNLNNQTNSTYGTFAGTLFTYSAVYQNSNISIVTYNDSNILTSSATGGFTGPAPSFDQVGAWNINGYTLNYYA